jgi:hypothetical protein
MTRRIAQKAAAYRRKDRQVDSIPEVISAVAVCCRGANIFSAKYPGGAATQFAMRRYVDAMTLEGVMNAEEIKNTFKSPEAIRGQ